jgi:hypothetical protein
LHELALYLFSAKRESNRVNYPTVRISASHIVGVSGNDIKVLVQAEGAELITEVKILLDGFRVGGTVFANPNSTYDESIPNAGFFPARHRLVVQVTDQTGHLTESTSVWNDS